MEAKSGKWEPQKQPTKEMATRFQKSKINQNMVIDNE